MIVGDYAFSQLGSSCSNKSYGSGKSRYVPYTSTIAVIIVFNIFTVVGTFYWLCLVFTYKNEGIHFYKRVETDQNRANNHTEIRGSDENMLQHGPDVPDVPDAPQL